MPRTMTETEARAHSAQVLADACNGEDIIITRNNRPVLRLVPVVQTNDAEKKRLDTLRKQREKAIESIKALRKTAVIGSPMTIEEIISARDEGRKYL